MKNILLLIIALLTSLMSLAQTIKNIEAKAVDSKIEVSYKIIGLKYYQNISAVNLYVKETGDKSFQGPMEFVSGDMAEGINNGEHKIIWDALKEMDVADTPLVFDVRVTVEDDSRTRDLMMMLVGNDVTPIGLRIGQLGKTSWYVEARASILALEKANYTYENGELTDYKQLGYYAINGDMGWQAYSIIAGITQQLHRNLFLYLGAGYGVENYIIGLNNYSYENDLMIDADWAVYKGYNTAGIEIDAGLLYSYKMLVFGAGGTALDFKSFGWTASLGIKF